MKSPRMRTFAAKQRSVQFYRKLSVGLILALAPAMLVVGVVGALAGS